MDSNNFEGNEFEGELYRHEADQPKVRAKPSKKTKGGYQEFLSMGLTKAVVDGVKFSDYRRPTPIQRAAIPVIKSGQDVVAMARTGSGKTAAFLIPMFEALKRHDPLGGARALILEPTRELAVQTLKFAKKLGRFTGLHCTLVVGGDSMDHQFDALHQHPDIIIATPGRLMHVCVEMSLSLDRIHYVVFDEADRLFELGFRDQLEEILARMPATRQTLLFSATLPQMLAEFAKAGLTNPTLIRLDKDEKLSEQLQLAFFSVSEEFKLHLLIYTVEKILKPDEQMIVFAATQVEVQFLENVFNKFSIPCTFLYSDMDPSSRKINTAKFQKKIVNVLIATDIAARGIDIPNLDYVLNYNFPGTAKVFVHRVGRAARAGKCGIAISFVTPEEEPYLWDLHKFLGRSVKFSPKLIDSTKSDAIEIDMISDRVSDSASAKKDNSGNNGVNWDYQFGSVPSEIFESENSRLKRLFHDDLEVQYLIEKKDKAYKLYISSRPKATKEALREMKEMRQVLTPGPHPFLLDIIRQYFKKENNNEGWGDSIDMMQKRLILIEKLHNVRPKKTIFEVGVKGSKSAGRVMQMKRKRDDSYISEYQKNLQEKKNRYQNVLQMKSTACQLPQMTDEDIFYEFPQTVTAQDEIQSAVTAKNKKLAELEESNQRKQEKQEKKKEKIKEKLAKKFGAEAKKDDKQKLRDEKLANNVKQGFFIPYQPADMYSERGYSVHSNFAKESKEAQLELQQDEIVGITRQKMIKKKWDTKKDKFTGKRLNEKKIKTESGRVIRASYKTDRYEAWMRRNKIEKQSLEGAAPGLEEAEEAEVIKTNANNANVKKPGRFQVLQTRNPHKVHPLLAEHNKMLKAKGHKVKEEVRTPGQVKKYMERQKKFAADRARGEMRKAIKRKYKNKRFKADE